MQKDKKWATRVRRARSKAGGQSSRKKGEAHQNAPGRPARLTRPSRARTRTHARDPGVASSDPKGEVLASTANTSGAPAEAPVERQTVRETGSASDRLRTGQPTAAHAAGDQHRRDPPVTTPSRGPKRVRRGANTASLPRPDQRRSQ